MPRETWTEESDPLTVGQCVCVCVCVSVSVSVFLCVQCVYLFAGMFIYQVQMFVYVEVQTRSREIEKNKGNTHTKGINERRKYGSKVVGFNTPHRTPFLQRGQWGVGCGTWREGDVLELLSACPCDQILFGQ